MKAEYISHYLTDADVAAFARQSFARAGVSYTPEQDAKLIRFLARGMPEAEFDEMAADLCGSTNTDTIKAALVQYRQTPTHWVPFGHPHISLAMQAPVPIARQAFKSKVGLVESEESRRYIKSEPVLFTPDEFRKAAENVKQGSAGPHQHTDYWRSKYRQVCFDAITLYGAMIDDGVCPEQARFVLPQGVEVHWVWTGSLYAFANFVIQRTDPHAQAEIQQLARQIDCIIRPLYPVSWDALVGDVK